MKAAESKSGIFLPVLAIFCVVAIPIIVISAFSSRSEGAGEKIIEPQSLDFDVFYEAWQLVEDQYDGRVPPNDELLYSAIEGSLKTLDDDYTRFVRPDVAARMREDDPLIAESLTGEPQPTIQRIEDLPYYGRTFPPHWKS